MGEFQHQLAHLERGYGGGGGGGALAFRCGEAFYLRPGAALLARGAAGGGAGTSSGSGLSPGGGGGGGTLLFQVGWGHLSFQGTLDVRGGPSLKSHDLYETVEMASAKGGDGYFRAESIPAPNPGAFSRAFPPPGPNNVGLLTDRDRVTSARSVYLGPTSPGGVVLQGYVLEGRENGKRVVYSDDPAKGIPPIFGKTPVAFFLQGGAYGGDRPSSKWVTTAKAFNDQKNWYDPNVPPASFRWTIVLDTSRLPSPANLEVRKVQVSFSY